MNAKKKPARQKIVRLPCMCIRQGKRDLILTALPVRILVQISYVAPRRQSTEEGAVQRPLNEHRIGKIRAFALAGGDFPVGMILNWRKLKLLKVSNNKKSLAITVEEESAQLIDGQHRVAGLEEAIEDKHALASMDIPVVIYRDLSTQECADIFLSINTEQKPVPKSLAYDLFGIASAHVVDPAAVRASDIADSLNTDPDSPYFGLVKYVGDDQPNRKRARLGIPLSTFVTAIKPLVAESGGLPSYKVYYLQNQTKAIMSFFKMLQKWYGDNWLAKDNAFMNAAGIAGGLDFFKVQMVPHCNSKKSYSVSTMTAAMDLEASKTISKKEAERQGGRAMARTIKNLLVKQFRAAAVDEGDIEFD